jgi:hypothetical protein
MSHVQARGKISVIEKSTKRPPATYSHTSGSTCIRTVEALRRSVKRRSETMSEAMII